MKTFNVHEAKTHFSSILALVAAGEEVLIAKAGTPVAVISAYRKPAAPREPGLFKGQIEIRETFFEPMDDDFMVYFQ